MTTPPPESPPVPGAARIPASFSQRRLWFLEQLEPGSPLYHIAFLIRLRGDLDHRALEHALGSLIERHEALRTHFVPVDAEPFLLIAATWTFALPVHDLSPLPAPERELELRRLGGEEARKPFDLRHDLLLRGRLYRLSPTEHVLSLVMHHLAFDGWSMAVIARELGACYDAWLHDRIPNLPELPIQYSDFALWQHEYLQGETLARLLAYWKTRLAGAPALLELPADFSRPPLPSHRGACQSHRLPPALVSHLREISSRHGLTLFMTLLAGFTAVLQRITGQTDLVVGSPLAGRNDAATEGLVGCFVNVMLLRTDLSGDPTVTELLARVRDTTLGALEHSTLPYERLVEELQPPRNLSFDPLCQVYFVLQNMPVCPLEFGGVASDLTTVHTGTAKSDLSVWATEQPDGAVDVTAEYALDLFKPDTIQRLLVHFETLLAGLAKNPACRLSHLPLMTAGERRRALVEWNATARDYPRTRCLDELFAAQVARTPGAIALSCGDRELTYAALAGHAEALAARLRRLRVGPDVLVAVCLERSLAMMIALLAVHRAGGAYVPLDPAYPAERLAFMLQDSQATVLLTHASLRAQLPDIPATVLLLDDPAPDSAPAGAAADPPSPAPPPLPRSSENLAYVIYTSGSTGRPKGVMVSHRNVVNFFAGMDQLLGTDPGVWLAATSISFDISVLELFWPLTHGYRVVLPAATGPLRPAALLTELARHPVTHFQCTPSFARILAGSPETLAHLGALKQFLIGGEALPAGLAEELESVLTGDLLNLYGPTETTIWSTAGVVRQTESVTGTVDLGRPLANQQVYVLDSHRQPVPVGVAGELWISGDGVTRGYLHRPDLTFERFTADPFRAGQRMYRTGDLARQRADGVIDFLGRADQQVKLRGHRIELGEIEAALLEHPGIREAAVVLRQDQTDNPQLAAYLVSAPGRPVPPPAALRTFLRRKLPGHMIPELILWVPQFPLTPNGKVDRQRLPAPPPPEAPATAPPPGNSLEDKVAAIWREILRLDQIGADDNFFDAGGHSLQVVQVQNRLREHLGLDVPVLKLFQFPTLRTLTGFLQDPPDDAGEADHFRARIEDRERRRQAALRR